MKAKHREQREARRLRAQGASLREISRRLQVSLSSASVWVRGVERPQIAASPPPVRWEPAQICTGCLRLLSESDFHRGQLRCKECRQEYMRLRGDLHRRQSKKALDRRRARARAYIIDRLMEGQCADCGLADPAVLEFDHVGAKSKEVGKLVREGYGLERIKAEIARCELVCANCHRRRTAMRCRSWRVDATWKSAVCTRRLRRRNLLFLRDYLREHPCVACGQSNPVVLDFHHIGRKTAGVVQLADRECAIDVLEREIAECEIRCANCHRHETIVEQQHFRNDLVTPP